MRAQGHRERFSMPERQKKGSSRPSRKILNARVAEKRGPKVIEIASRCPNDEKKEAQGHRERFSMPERQKKESSR
jgi:hypothetical protein